MSLWKALLYFFGEACSSLVRSWRISAISVLTMAVTLFLCSGFLLVVQNVSELVGEWRRGLKVVVYLESDLGEGSVEALDRELREAPWVRELEVVDPEEATRRFREAFPGLGEVADSWETPPFPTSYEVSVDAEAARVEEFERWLDVLRASPAVEMVDADRDWLEQMAALLRLVSVAGAVVGALLLSAAILTAASIQRLTAHLQREETAIMRLVGATEFYVRGPFWVSGMIQGLLGGALALAALAVTVVVVRSRDLGGAWSEWVLGEFLEPASVAAVVCLGGAAGLLGAVLSLRRERQDLEPLG